MTPLPMYEAIVVDGAPDLQRPGHIRVKIPELYGREEVPELVPPLYPGSPAGGWQSVPGPLLPDGTEARVTVVMVAPYTFRWLGSQQGWSKLEGDSTKRCGAQSPDGRHYIVLQDDAGVVVLAAGAGTKVKLIGPTVLVAASESAAGEGMILGETFLTELSQAVAEIQTGLTALGQPTVNCADLVTKITTSLASKAPLLSAAGKVA